MMRKRSKSSVSWRFPSSRASRGQQLRNMPVLADLQTDLQRRFRCSNARLSLMLVLLLVVLLQQAVTRVEGASTGDNTHSSSSSRRFNDPGATFYDLLGVSRHASQQEIKRVFRKLAIKLHPDKLGPFESEEEEEKANAVFVKVCHLYQCTPVSSMSAC